MYLLVHGVAHLFVHGVAHLKWQFYSNSFWKESNEGWTHFFIDEEKRFDGGDKDEEWTCSFTVEHCSSYFSMYCVSHFCS